MSLQTARMTGHGEVFQNGVPAWYIIGKDVQKAKTWKQASHIAKMDYRVNKEQLEFQGEKVNAYGLFRGDNSKFLNAVGKVYTPIQSEECFSFVDTILGNINGAHFVSAGDSDGGKVVWCMAAIPDEIRIKGTDDISKNYMLFADFRKQGKSAIGKLTNTRICCGNSINIALRSVGDFFRVRHTGNIQERILSIRDTFANVQNDIKLLNDKMNFLAGKKMTKPSMTKIIKTVFPRIEESELMKDKAEKLLEIYESNDNDTFPETRGTAYNLLNSITNYVDHVQNVTLRNQDGTGQLVQVREQKRAESAMFGTGDRLKSEILDNIVETVQHNPSMGGGIGDTKKVVLANILDSMSLDISKN